MKTDTFTSLHYESAGEARDSRAIPHYNKGNLHQAHSQHHPNGEKLKGYLLAPHLFNIVLEVLARAIRQPIKGYK